ncbi:transaldolase [Pendulispora brunnea]|uniref:Transaldolase n=1 Tax=Pendulispora brunnea TaxID=2905690 RepID=A0ABZ2K8B6_9BACT
MNANPIQRLYELGQSAWLDFISRDLLTSGELRRLVQRDGLRGVTSNPTIFQKAIAGSADYDAFIDGAHPSEADAAVLERIMVRDLQLACDELFPIYERTGGTDGFASIEVSPVLAHETVGSIDQAQRLWTAVGRPNLMVKIPATREGLPAIEQCLVEGININVTLLFGVPRYLEVVKAYLRALETRAAQNRAIDRVASVASFFVSRVDTKVDKILDMLAPSAAAERGKSLRGKIAIANAKVAYAEFERIAASDRWHELAAKGARPQRLLWGSSSSKDPAYPDTYYVEALAGPRTVNTMPLETFRAYLDHGRPEIRIIRDRDLAFEQIAELVNLGIDFDAIVQTLEDEGVASFIESYDKAVHSISGKRRQRRSA